LNDSSNYTSSPTKKTLNTQGNSTTKFKGSEATYKNDPMGLLNNKKSSFTKAQQAVKNLETSLNQLQNDSTKKGGVKDKNSGSLETGGDSEYYDEFGESEQS